jgi:hypothetical protein
MTNNENVSKKDISSIVLLSNDATLRLFVYLKNALNKHSQ